MINFFSFFVPLGPLGLIIVQHFPKKYGNARMPPSGKNIVYIIQIQQLVKYSLSDWVVMMKMVMRMVVSDHQKSFFVRTYECHSYHDPKRKDNLLVCYINYKQSKLLHNQLKR